MSAAPSRARHDGLSRLNHDAATASRGVDDGIENRTQLRSIGVLFGDEVVCSGAEKVRIAEAFHDQQLLRIAVDVLLREPLPQLTLISKSARSDPPVPFDQPHAGSSSWGF